MSLQNAYESPSTTKSKIMKRQNKAATHQEKDSDCQLPSTMHSHIDTLEYLRMNTSYKRELIKRLIQETNIKSNLTLKNLIKPA
jgi:hypothetical protein